MRFRLWLPLFLIGLVLVGCARLPTPEGWSGGAVAEDVTYRGDVYERVLYVGTREGDLRALVAEDQTGPNASGGEELWSFPLRGDVEADLVVYGTPVVARDTIFFASYHGFLYSLSLDGEELWDTRIGDGDHVVGGVAVADDLVLVGSNDGNVYAYEYDFENHDATLRWVFDRRAPRSWSTPAVHEGAAYFGSLDQHVYAVDLATGAEIWRFKTEGGVVAGPAVADGKVLVGSFDSTFYAIDAATGQEAWTFEGAEQVVLGPRRRQGRHGIRAVPQRQPVRHKPPGRPAGAGRWRPRVRSSGARPSSATGSRCRRRTAAYTWSAWPTAPRRTSATSTTT